ncbi:MAG TPA: AraC family transcriptional regulator [Pyrinomonadaceae bacterium]|nr:AraC family transcriptional regulator [Pyrinomonadaceae bacterium]
MDLQLNPDDGADVNARRKLELLSSGAFLIEDDVKIKSSRNITFMMCEAWLLGLFELKTGNYSFMRGGEQVHPKTRHFGIFYPPFAIMRVCVEDIRGHWAGMAATIRLPEKFMAVPILFETTFTAPPKSVEQVEEILNSSYNRQSIELNPMPSLLSIQVKRLIDENYLALPSIAGIASRLGVTHAHLTRQFKSDFGLSPSAYSHQMRITDATFRLARGEEIIDIAQDVGYNDLSNFYKQFRKAKAQTPGYCRAPKKRNHT